MKTGRMSLSHFKNALSTDQMKSIKGGIEAWSCTCGGTSWNGWGTAGDLRDDFLNYCEGGSIAAYCNFTPIP